MSRTIARRQTPEQHELTRRRLQLSALRAALATRERAFADLRAQLHSFEGRYIRQVGVLYKQLDEWEQKIAELNSPLMAPTNPDAPEALEAPDRDTLDASADRAEDDARGADQPEVLLDLKALFRELAKRVHPDFASNPSDAQLRTLLMAQANDAFRRKDAGMLQRMLNGHDAADRPQTAAEELALVLDQITHVEGAITEVDTEAEALTHSELAKLQQRTLLAAQQGRDLLAEMAARVKGNIGMAMRRYELDLERKKRKQPAFDPTALLSAEVPYSR